MADTPRAPADDQRAPSFTRQLATLTQGVLVAVAGGIGATGVYDRLVTPPTEVPSPLVAPPPSATLPPAEGIPDGAAIDPLQQAMRAVRPDLPEGAILEVQATAVDGVVYLRGEAESRRTVAMASEAVGRVAGIRAVDVRGVRIVDRSHTVGPGESLSRIARQYYGHPTEWRRIVEANPGLDPDLVREGQILVIPPVDR